MPSDRSSHPECTVIATVDAAPADMPDLLAHARVGIARFGECAGFIGGSLHLSDDGGRLVQYLRWSSRAEYEHCRDDPHWDSTPTTQRFMALVSSGIATLDVRIFDVVARSG